MVSLHIILICPCFDQICVHARQFRACKCSYIRSLEHHCMCLSQENALEFGVIEVLRTPYSGEMKYSSICILSSISKSFNHEFHETKESSLSGLITDGFNFYMTVWIAMGTLVSVIMCVVIVYLLKKRMYSSAVYLTLTFRLTRTHVIILIR